MRKLLNAISFFNLIKIAKYIQNQSISSINSVNKSEDEIAAPKSRSLADDLIDSQSQPFDKNLLTVNNFQERIKNSKRIATKYDMLLADEGDDDDLSFVKRETSFDDDNYNADRTDINENKNKNKNISNMSSWVNKSDSNHLEDSSSSISLPITQLNSPPINMVCVQVIRSWDLPETLTDTNPYVIIDWGKLGISKTQTIQNTIEPVFNSTLRFRFPFDFDCNYDAITNLKMKAHQLPSLKIYIYSKNFSISDELLGETDLKAEYFINLTLSNPNDSKLAGGTIPIYDNHKSLSRDKITGYIEFKTFSFT